jgi:hypothetical protein
MIVDAVLLDVAGSVWKAAVSRGERRKIKHPTEKCGLIEAAAPVNAADENSIRDVAASDPSNLHTLVPAWV